MQKVTLQICQRKFLWLKKLKILLWAYVIDDVNRQEICRTNYEKELQKPYQTKLRVEKVIKGKGDKL